MQILTHQPPRAGGEQRKIARLGTIFRNTIHKSITEAEDIFSRLASSLIFRIPTSSIAEGNERTFNRMDDERLTLPADNISGSSSS